MKSAGILIAVALAAVPFSATAAAGDEMVPDFSALCLTGKTGAADVVSAARARGYFTPPEALMREYMPPEFRTGRLVWKASEGIIQEVIVGQIDMAADEMTADVCAVAIMPAITLRTEALTSALGVGSPTATEGANMYTFEETDGRRTRVDPSASGRIVSLMARGQLRMVMVMSDKTEDISMIMYMTPKPH